MPQADVPSASEMPCQVPRNNLAGSLMSFPGSCSSLMKAGLLMEPKDISVRRAMFQPEIVPGVQRRSLMCRVEVLAGSLSWAAPTSWI